jgi:hypothetical protein
LYDAAAGCALRPYNPGCPAIFRYAAWAAVFQIRRVVRLPFDSGFLDQSRDRRAGPINVVVYLSLHGEAAYFLELQRIPRSDISQMSGTHQVIRRVLVTVALLSIWHGSQAMAEPVRIAYPEVFPPFTELKDGKAEGLAVEIVRAAAKQMPGSRSSSLLCLLNKCKEL